MLASPKKNSVWLQTLAATLRARRLALRFDALCITIAVLVAGAGAGAACAGDAAGVACAGAGAGELPSVVAVACLLRLR